MKSLLLTIAMFSSIYAGAYQAPPLPPGVHYCDEIGYHNDDKDAFCQNNYGRYFPPALACYVRDASTRVYRSLARYTSANVLASRALSDCYSQSSQPKSCKLLGCKNIRP